MNRLLLSFGGFNVTAEAHPNKMKFKGVLVRLDEPSDKAPSGSNGHKILVPKSLAKSRLTTIKSMGLNYSPTLDGHAQRRKVGVINKAWIDGNNLCVEGTIWKHDFPEAEQDLKQAGLGMSMEIGDVEVADQDAPVWTLTDFKFLGATILFKNAAAYHKTMAIAASKEKNMLKTKKKVAAAQTKTELSNADVAKIAAAAAGEVVKAALAPVVKGMQRQNQALAAIHAKFEEMELDQIAAGHHTEEDDDMDADSMEPMPTMMTKKVKAEDGDDDGDDEDGRHHEPDGDEDDDDGDDDEDVDAEGLGDGTDKGDLEDMGPDLPESEEGDEPGDFNKKGKENFGDKTTSDDKLGPHVSKGVTGSAAYKALKKRFVAMAQENQTIKAQLSKLTKKVGKVQAQADRVSKDMGRKSIAASSEVTGVLAKAGYNASEIYASGQKLTWEQVDGMLAGMSGLSTVDRMTLKNKFLEAGIVDQGAKY